VYNTPLLDLVFKAASVHRMYNDPQMVRGGGRQGDGGGRLRGRGRGGAGGGFRQAGGALFVLDSGAPKDLLFHQAPLSPTPPPPPATPPPPSPTPQVQRCTLLSIKTGGCPENCSYCSQSSHWSEDTGLKAEKLMGLEDVYEVGLSGCFLRGPQGCWPAGGASRLTWCAASLRAWPFELLAPAS
jgi:hypothetical protein